MNLKIYLQKKKLEKVKIKLSKKIDKSHGYSILKDSKSLKENEFMYNISKKYDNYGFISQELGQELDNLFLDDNYIIGIHRTGYTLVDDNTLDNIFNIGLINNGHIMGGGGTGVDNIENTVSIFNDFSVFIGQLKVANNYKGSQGCIIVKILKSYLGKGEGEIKPIYYCKNKINILLPEFIYGYIPVNKDGIVGNLIRNKNYKDTHEYKNDNLIYDTSVTRYLKREIIKQAFIDTYNEYGIDTATSALNNFINNLDTSLFLKNENSNKLNDIKSDNIKYILSNDPTNQKNMDDVVNNFINQILNIDNNKIL